MALKIKSSSTSSTTKTTRTLSEKVEVLVLISQGLSVKESLAQVFGSTTTPAMDNHPHSILSGFKKSIQKAIEAGDKSVIDTLLENDLLEDDEDKKEVTASETIGQAVYTDKELEDSPDYDQDYCDKD